VAAPPDTGRPPARPPEAEPLLRLRGLGKLYQSAGGSFHLWVEELEVRPGQRLALVGESGCGKSTLLDLLALVLAPQEAQVFLYRQGSGLDAARAWRRQEHDRLAGFRRRHLGYVLQTGGLLPFLTAGENIRLTPGLAGRRAGREVERLVARLGLAGLERHKPHQLSVGQRQRVAIARALAHGPALLLADEPTGSLDPVSAGEVMVLLGELAEKAGAALVVATHHRELAREHGFSPVRFRLAGRSAGRVRAEVLA
jgi:putative ABC transport system ATP-binding protein